VTGSRAANLFEAANQAWFEEGRLRRAVETYRQAMRADPADPVIRLQLARALRARGEISEAEALMAEAARHGERLSPLGRQELEGLRGRLSTPFRHVPPVPEADLDLDRLSGARLTTQEWMTVALAAEERELFALAAYALRRAWAEAPGPEAARDVEEMRYEAASSRAALAAMRAGHEQAASTGQAARRRGEVSLEADVSPETGTSGEPVTLTVALLNTGDEPIGVNARMLLNRETAPLGYGEIFVRVAGPTGYENLTRFTIRAGKPQDDDFQVLQPRERVVRTYDLLRYQSLHLPRKYRLHVLYRNAVRHTVGGVPVFVGSVDAPPVTHIRLVGEARPEGPGHE
jgi:Tetratricopeptide repeat